MQKKYCLLSGETLPIIAQVDVVVIGGTVGAIAAARTAAMLGSKVFVVASHPYLGEDICGSYKHFFEEQVTDHPLLAAMFPRGASRAPFGVKKALEDCLIDCDVQFVYSSFATQVITVGRKGVVIANRSGRQVVSGNVIVDATPFAYVARLAGAKFKHRNSDSDDSLQFITVGNRSQSSLQNRQLPISPWQDDKEYPAYEHSFVWSVPDWSYPALCAAEQDVRDQVWDADQVDSADNLFFVPPFCIEAEDSCQEEQLHVATVSLGAFQPRAQKDIYVLSGCGNISRNLVSELLRPENCIILGERIGEAAATACHTGTTGAPSCTAMPSSSELLTGALQIIAPPRRSAETRSQCSAPAAYIPVIGEYEVVVVGGGTAGANAAISAARHGAKTLVMEYLHALGGTQTVGMIGCYWDGYREGFTKEIDVGVSAMAPLEHPRQKPDKHRAWNFDWKVEWYRRQIRAAGGDIWFGALGCGAFVKDSQVQGVLIATPEGLGVVLGKVVIDATGSGDIAIAAGADYEYTDKDSLAVQGAGLPPVNLGDHYNNTDWTFIDDSDVTDITRVFVAGKAKYKEVYDVGKLPQTRERRRIVGEHRVSVADVLNHRRYPDTISHHRSSFDTHGYTVDPFFTIKSPAKRHVIYEADLPLRSLLPLGIDGIIVTGLGVSAHRDAMPIIRMQPCLQNQGYSIGYLSSIAVKEDKSIRDVDIKKVQQYLVKQRILPQRVLTDEDSFPLPDEKFQQAVCTLPDDFAGLEVILSDPHRAEPMLLSALAQAKESCDTLTYAQVLCMLGNSEGWRYVQAAVESYQEWDEGWNYTGMGQFGPCMSPLDSLLIALGESKKEAALPAILAKAQLLTSAHALSHFQAVSLACLSIASVKAASVLAAMLDLEGITGHHLVTLQQARAIAAPSPVDVSLRNRALRELYLARALYYCGDVDNKGRTILKHYSNDLHGHYFRHAQGTLNGLR